LSLQRRDRRLAQDGDQGEVSGSAQGADVDVAQLTGEGASAAVQFAEPVA
jgi:hypothetical protein